MISLETLDDLKQLLAAADQLHQDRQAAVDSPTYGQAEVFSRAAETNLRSALRNHAPALIAQAREAVALRAALARQGRFLDLIAKRPCQAGGKCDFQSRIAACCPTCIARAAAAPQGGSRPEEDSRLADSAGGEMPLAGGSGTALGETLLQAERRRADPAGGGDANQ
jgi:hypothetical protein